jgi:hypothetical protein
VLVCDVVARKIVCPFGLSRVTLIEEREGTALCGHGEEVESSTWRQQHYPGLWQGKLV